MARVGGVLLVLGMDIQAKGGCKGLEAGARQGSQVLWRSELCWKMQAKRRLQGTSQAALPHLRPTAGAWPAGRRRRTRRLQKPEGGRQSFRRKGLEVRRQEHAVGMHCNWRA